MSLTGTLAQARIDARQQAFRAVLGHAGFGFRDLVRALAAYCGPLPHDAVAFLGTRLHAMRPELFESAGHVERLVRVGGLGDIAAARDAAAPYTFFAPASEAEFTRHELLPRADNAYCSTELPALLSRRLHQAHCPSLELVSATDMSLFCSPEGFQVFQPARGVCARSATSRPLSTAVRDVPGVEVDRLLVLVQDVFHGANFAHFLFDWVIRVMAFAAHGPVDPRACLFVMGGFPGPFHRLIIRALLAELGLTEDNVFFPEDEVVLRSRTGVFWFSDTTTASAHPAQMFRPEATGWIRRLARAVIGRPPPRTRRLYISRADARRRMVANEPALLAALEGHGFETVLLGNMPVAEQIALMASAAHVIGAHGMGLTTLAFNPGTPTLLELFNPTFGTDAYAFMARGLGFAYTPLLGRPTGAGQDFSIDFNLIKPYLPGATGPRPTSAARRGWLAAQRWSGGVQTVKAVRDTTGPRRESGGVLRHVRDGITEDSNVGWWELNHLEPGMMYTARCYLCIPAASGVTEVALHFYGGTEAVISPDVSRRDCWQALALNGVCVPETGSANLVVRMNGAADCTVLTSGWTVTGPWPTEAGGRAIATLRLDDMLPA